MRKGRRVGGGKGEYKLAYIHHAISMPVVELLVVVATFGTSQQHHEGKGREGREGRGREGNGRE